MTVCFDMVSTGARERIDDVEYMEVVWEVVHGRPTRFYRIYAKDGNTQDLKCKDRMIYWVQG